MKAIRWGIMGLGSIAKAFAEGLRAVEGAELVACASRSKEKAEAFGAERNIPRRYGSYEELARDGRLDAIYVATPHPFHAECTRLCLEAGRAVLCEKPFTVNAKEAAAVVAVARRRKVFLMEAIWSRFLPHVRAAVDVIASGRIGEVRMLQADFAFRCGWNPEGRLLNPALAGGGLLDVGVYTVSLASMLLGRPREIRSLCHIGATGVDEQAAMLFGYDGGALAVLSCGVRTNSPHEATIMGTEGRIRMHAPWWSPSKITVSTSSGEETIDPARIGNGYNYEAVEVGRCLREGLLESPIVTLDETISTMETLDAIRAQWGLTYPME
jgi:dihydrodiol dehydrogenase / D-xylose 1-dehydrogenase (NADP)